MKKFEPKHWLIIAVMAGGILGTLPVFAEEEKPKDNPAPAPAPALAIAELKRTETVDFEKEILPILKNNCLACHNQTKAKGDLILETPQTILKGGETGPAVVAGKSGESLLLRAAAHQTKPHMPPKDNKVNANELTPEELGLVKLWIDQGAKGEVHGSGPIEWQPLPAGLNPIYAVSVAPDGQFAACGRANQIFIYHVPSGQLVGRLTDPQLIKEGLYGKPGAAHRDLVQSLAFSPDGDLLASGSFREVKLWRRPRNVQKLALTTSNVVTTVATSPDGKWLATGGADGAIKLFDLNDGTEAKVLNAHTQAVTALKFSADNARLLSASADYSLGVWSAASGALLARAQTSNEVNAVAWVGVSNRLAAAGADKLIRLWQVTDGTNAELKLVKELSGHEGAVTALDAWPDGQRLLSGSADGSVRVWNCEDGKSVRELKQGGPVTAVAIRSDGQRFASAGLNNVTRLWNTEDGKQLAEMKGDRYAQEAAAELERTLSFAKSEGDYRKNAVASAEKEDKARGEKLSKASETNSVAEKAFAEKQKTLKDATEGKTAAEKALADLSAEIKKITDSFQEADKLARQATAQAKTAIEKSTLAKLAADQASQTKLETEKIAADTAAVAAKSKGGDEKTAADAAALAAKAKAFADSVEADASAKAKSATEARTAADKAVDEVASRAFAAGQIKPVYDKIEAEGPGRLKEATNKIEVATRTVTETEKEFQKAEKTKSLANQELEIAKHTAKEAVDALTGARAALEGAENFQKRTDTDAQTAKKAAADSEKPVRALAFSPDGRTLATAGDDQFVHTWSAETGAAFETFHGHTGVVSGVAFARASRLVSVAGQRAVVWDMNTEWALERTIGTGDMNSPIIDRVNALDFSPDGQLLATGSGEPTRSSEIKLWKVADGSLAQEFKNTHSDTVLSLDFSADGKFLASGGADKFARVIDLASGKLVKSFEGHTHHVLGVSWKRDGRTLASSGGDNVIKVWDFMTGEKKKNIEGFGKEVTSIQFVSNSDQAVATGGDSQVRLVRENGESVRSFSGPTDFMYSASCTPDGRLLVAGGQDSVLRVWNAADGKAITTFEPPKEK